MENRVAKLMKRSAFHLKLDNYSDFDESCPSPKRCKTFDENIEENAKSDEFCDKIRIIVKDIKELREFEIRPDAFVSQLKGNISKDFKIPFAQVSLYSNGLMLRDENTLSNSNVQEGSKVYLIRNINRNSPNCTTRLRSREKGNTAYKPNSVTEYILSTPDIPNCSEDDFRNSEEPTLSQAKENKDESSTSFDSSMNVDGIAGSFMTFGEKPSEEVLGLFNKTFAYMETLIKKVDQLEQTTKYLMEIIEQGKAGGANNRQGSPVLLERMVMLPSHVQLPLNTDDDLNYFEQLLACDEEVASKMVKYLYQSSHGKSPCSFILNLTKLIMSQELASGYSRLGRKGKKSFLPYKNITDIILAAAAKKFSTEDRDTLYEKFGKALANAPDWSGRESRKGRFPMITGNELNMCELVELKSEEISN